jgi:predicted RNase H-like nuclease (RuvC/YqgF family)
MKSDTDFTNPYEKELHAQESKIKELTATIKELNQWYEDEHDRRVELEKKLVEAQERIDSESAFHIEAARLLTVEQESLKIAVEALEKIVDVDTADEGYWMYKCAEEALIKIEGTK